MEWTCVYNIDTSPIPPLKQSSIGDMYSFLTVHGIWKISVKSFLSGSDAEKSFFLHL